jgi:hypothetical protein
MRHDDQAGPGIHDLTENFRQAEWTGERERDEVLFDEKIRGIRRGVYVHYLENDHAYPVHDRNGESKGKGKLLIRAHLASIKFGKFESGLVGRRSQDAKHMHRKDPSRPQNVIQIAPPAPGTFAECLRLAVVLDLTGRDKEDVRGAERHLRSEPRCAISWVMPLWRRRIAGATIGF